LFSHLSSFVMLSSRGRLIKNLSSVFFARFAKDVYAPLEDVILKWTLATFFEVTLLCFFFANRKLFHQGPFVSSYTTRLDFLLTLAWTRVFPLTSTFKVLFSSSPKSMPISLLTVPHVAKLLTLFLLFCGIERTCSAASTYTE